jgi:hypothetical protein
LKTSSSARNRVDERDLLQEVGVNDDLIDDAVHEFLRCTDASFFSAIETMGYFGRGTPGFVKLCDRMTRDAREARTILTRIAGGT